MNWIYLSLAIGCEVLATSALKATEGFTRACLLTIVAEEFHKSVFGQQADIFGKHAEQTAG